ncbi:MAG TPA: hypothetical protein VGE57_07350 [Solimonas sp.]
MLALALLLGGCVTTPGNYYGSSLDPYGHRSSGVVYYNTYDPWYYGPAYGYGAYSGPHYQRPRDVIVVERPRYPDRPDHHHGHKPRPDRPGKPPAIFDPPRGDKPSKPPHQRPRDPGRAPQQGRPDKPTVPQAWQQREERQRQQAGQQRNPPPRAAEPPQSPRDRERRPPVFMR